MLWQLEHRRRTGSCLSPPSGGRSCRRPLRANSVARAAAADSRPSCRLRICAFDSNSPFAGLFAVRLIDINTPIISIRLRSIGICWAARHCVHDPCGAFHRNGDLVGATGVEVVLRYVRQDRGHAIDDQGDRVDSTRSPYDWRDQQELAKLVQARGIDFETLAQRRLRTRLGRAHTRRQPIELRRVLQRRLQGVVSTIDVGLQVEPGVRSRRRCECACPGSRAASCDTRRT